MQFRPLIHSTERNAKIARVKDAFLQPVMSRPSQAGRAGRAGQAGHAGHAGQTRAHQAVFLLSAILIDWYSALLYYYLLNLSSLKDPPG